ncbi:MAG: hypothetical protein GQ475_07280 [Methylococcaceae bacterium]|nr:hypothetical protein [Methylococcaceae bacterium]
MRKIKPDFDHAKGPHGIVVLKNIPHQGLIKANRALLLIASVLMVVVFILGFLLMPEDDMVNSFKAQRGQVSNVEAIQNPVLTAEINILKGQLVGIVSGSIESKLRALESSVRTGSVSDSLGTIQGLKNDVKVLQAYSVPNKVKAEQQQSRALLQEVSQLKRLIYLTVTSCGLMFAAIAGVWIRKRFYLTAYSDNKKAALRNENK